MYYVVTPGSRISPQVHLSVCNYENLLQLKKVGM